MDHLAGLLSAAEAQFSRMLATASAGAPSSFAGMEEQLLPSCRELGGCLMAVFLESQARRFDVDGYLHSGRVYGPPERRTQMLHTRFGRVSWRQPFARPVHRREGRAQDFPADRAMGLAGGFSLGVGCLLLHLCAQVSFGQARQLYKRLHGVVPAPASVLRMVDAAGPLATSFLADVPGPTLQPDMVLGIFVDARGAPTVTEEELYRRRKRHGPHTPGRKCNRRAERRARCRLGHKPRRTGGQKSKNAKGIVVGVLVLWQRLPDGSLEGPVHKHVCSSLDGHRGLFEQLKTQAARFGYGNLPAFFYADGCAHIWRLQNEYFPTATPCIDVVHVLERIWQCGETRFAPGSQELRAFVDRQHQRLLAGNVALVLKELRNMLKGIPKTGPGNAGRRKRLGDNLGYLEDHQHRMAYKKLREQDVDIGTGIVEGAVRHLIALRLDGPGMRWGLNRLRHVLALRTVLINGLWDRFEDCLKAQTVRLPARPQMATPHVTRPREAA